MVALERAGLLQAEFNEEDIRRKTINVTSKGWLVSWARNKFGAGTGQTEEEE